MSFLRDRNYLGGLLRDDYGKNLIMIVTEYGASRISGPIIGARPGCNALGQALTLYNWPRRNGDSLSGIVNYRHNCLVISVVTKLYEILDYDG
jgi:hypothetical protein